MSPSVISTTMMMRHLAQLTVAWFNHRDMPPLRVDDYAEHAERVWASARRAGDAPWFALGLRHALATPGYDASELTNERFAYSDATARELFAYLLRVMPADVATAGEPGSVEFRAMTRPEWEALRDTA